ncbi:MAG TPA: DoxX-like family protein [Thermoleophilaceae bacterium]|jgi:hypothetical protein
MASDAVYVEARIDCSLERLWELTQDPAAHRRWDLRFSRIEYLPRADDEPQRFLYERSVLPWLTVRGWGETTGERFERDGAAASALAFGSDQRRSLIRSGSGYWRYESGERGVRFVTRYDYEPRWGAIGRLVDRLAFRRLLGWATAWSFDRLRLWLEESVSPERSLRSAQVHAVAAGALSAAWLYQGAVPKLLVRDAGEIELLRRSGLVRGREEHVLAAVGLSEVCLALAVLTRADRRWPWTANFVVLPLLAAGALESDRGVFARPFNPGSLTLAMLGLAAVGGLTRADRPSARRCAREPSE